MEAKVKPARANQHKPDLASEAIERLTQVCQALVTAASTYAQTDCTCEECDALRKAIDAAVAIGIRPEVKRTRWGKGEKHEAAQP